MKKFQSVNESRERLGGVSRKFLMKFDKPGISYRIGRKILFDADALDAAIEEMQQAAGGKEVING